jgi:glycosyltransferase involved in cell wall biosynthesis
VSFNRAARRRRAERSFLDWEAMPTDDLLEIQNIGFVSTRVAGTDGVSLEIGKWANVLAHMGFDCRYICGKSDRPDACTFIIEEADYHHPVIQEMNQQVFGRTTRSRQLSKYIRDTSAQIKDQLYAAVDQHSLDLLIAENSLTIPLNIPLGAALLEFLIETRIPCIAHHHDFPWERERFLVNAVNDYVDAVFPPEIADIDHVVINSLAGEEFGRRTGLPYRLIPNVMDFAHPPAEMDDYAGDFRQSIGVGADDLLILQPTRVVARKGIEHTIELVRRLNDPRCKLVLTHSAGDEGDAYPRRVRDYAELLGVELIFATEIVSEQRGETADGRKQYAIWDVYPHADLVAFPSTHEGFGNAFLEAIYYRKPILCNRYTIFRTDIEPCGFECIVMDGFLTDDVIKQVKRVLGDETIRQDMVDHNYRLAREYFSFERVEQELQSILRRPRPRCQPILEQVAQPRGRGRVRISGLAP